MGLLREIEESAKRLTHATQVIGLGDYVDRGPDFARRDRDAHRMGGPALDRIPEGQS